MFLSSMIFRSLSIGSLLPHQPYGHLLVLVCVCVFFSQRFWPSINEFSFSNSKIIIHLLSQPVLNFEVCERGTCVRITYRFESLLLFLFFFFLLFVIEYLISRIKKKKRKMFHFSIPCWKFCRPREIYSYENQHEL